MTAPGLFGDHQGTCVACLVPADTGLAIEGEAEYLTAVFTVFGIDYLTAAAMTGNPCPCPVRLRTGQSPCHGHADGVTNPSSHTSHKRDSVTHMGRQALSPHGGTSPKIHLRLAAEDADRLDQLADRRQVNRSEAVRELIKRAIAADTGPPKGGAAA